MRTQRLTHVIPAHLAFAAAMLMQPATAGAHPLGNSSVTRFSVLYVLPDRLEIDLLLDIAEEPSRLVRENEIDADKDGEDTADEQKAWLDRKAAEFAPLLKPALDGRPLTPRTVSHAVDPKTGGKAASSRLILKMAGFMSMPTYRILIRYVAPYPGALAPGEHVLTYQDDVFTNAPGLRRILLERTRSIDFVGDRPDFWDEGDDPFRYEQYDPGSLPQEKSATVRFKLQASAARAVATKPAATIPSVVTTANPPPVAATQNSDTKRQDSPPPYLQNFTDPRNDPSRTAKSFRQADRLIALLQGRWGVLMLLTVTALSFTWGAAHALMPGHAKTVVAAYLISQRGTYWHAVLLAIIVTITHTALVVIMGLVIWFYQASHPTLGQRIQLWLGTIAGILVAIMGASLVWRAWTGRIAHHHHDHDHDHDHDHAHDHRSWWRRLFTHSHPHLPGASHGHDHNHGHDHAHPQAHSHEGLLGHTHTHDHVHAHSHDDETHTHDHEHPHAHEHVHEHGHAAPARPSVDRSEPLNFRLLLILGITGGIVPCPTAMIIMLLGIGTNVVAGALYAVGVFSMGLALTLMAIGFVALSSRRFAAKVLFDAEHEGELSSGGRRLLMQIVPTISGLLVLALGAAITAHYVYMIQTGRILIPWMG